MYYWMRQFKGDSYLNNQKYSMIIFNCCRCNVYNLGVFPDFSVHIYHVKKVAFRIPGTGDRVNTMSLVEQQGTGTGTIRAWIE